MPTRDEIISKTSAINTTETVELAEFLSSLRKSFRIYNMDEHHIVDLDSDTRMSLNRSYACTPIVAESPFLLVVLDGGTYLVSSWNPHASRRLRGIDFMYRKKPASRLSKTAIYCHVLSIAPLTVQVVDLLMFLGHSLLTNSWDHRLEVAKVELNFPRPLNAVKVEFPQRYRIAKAINALQQTPFPCIGLYFIHNLKTGTGQVAPSVIRWIGSAIDASEDDLFGEYNVEFRLATWMKSCPLPEPKISQFQQWRNAADKSCFGADWLSSRSSSLSIVDVQEIIAGLYPELDQEPNLKRCKSG